MTAFFDRVFGSFAAKDSEIQELRNQVAELQSKLKKQELPPGISVLDHGYVYLDEYMGSDLAVVNNARQSFGVEHKELTERDRGLINFLARERHGTPFERAVFAFNIKCPIFVAREWMRHRIGSFNEYSGRYTKMISDFYIPKDKDFRTQTGKPGAYKFEPVEPNIALTMRTRFMQNADECWEQYEEALELGVAKEVARMLLPVNIYTMFTWVVNLRSLMNFISLRSHETAMWEIRQYSIAIERLIKDVTPVAYESFLNNGRVAP